MCVQQKKEKDIYNQDYPTMEEQRKSYKKENSKRIGVLTYVSVNIVEQVDNDRH
jgi:hypothetical protein